MAILRPDADTLVKVITDPEFRKAYLARLSLPQRQAFLKKLGDALRNRGLAAMQFADPAQMMQETGVKQYDFTWQARHLQFLSKRVAQTVRQHKNLAIMMPPRCGKSTICSVLTPTWGLVEDPRLEIILLTYGDDFAQKWGGATRDLVLEYGEKWNIAVDPDHTASKAWRLTAKGSMHTAGISVGAIGRGARLLVCDDLMKEEDADSPVLRDKVWDRFSGTALSRVEQGGSILVIMQRWHEDDIVGRLEKQALIGEGLGTQFDFIRLPAMAEKGDVLGRAEGEGLWPERIAQETWEKRKQAVSPYVWSSVYQQRPSPEGGGLVLRTWWRYYNPADRPAAFDRVVQTWDLPLKDKQTSDFAAGFVLGIKDALIYVLAGWIKHAGLPEVIQQFHIFQTMFPQAGFKLIEDKASGPAFIQVMRRRVAGIVPVQAIASKTARLNAAIPAIASGNVLFPENPDGTKHRWVWDTIEQCAQFPKGTHDDAVDALVQGINWLDPLGHASVVRAQGEAYGMLPDIAVDPRAALAQKLFGGLKQSALENAKLLSRQSGWHASDLDEERVEEVFLDD